MGFIREYVTSEPSRQEVHSLSGTTVLEFGNSWCGYCRRAEPLIEAAFACHDSVRHIRISDGPNRRLGRYFKVKLWPTLVFLKDGNEIARVVRPNNSDAIEMAFDKID